jgi:hypothetical protein
MLDLGISSVVRQVDLLETLQRKQVVLAHEVHQATRGGDENITPHLELLALVLGRRTTIDDARTQHSAVTQSTRLKFVCMQSVCVSSVKFTLKVHAVFYVVLCTYKTQRMPSGYSAVLGNISHLIEDLAGELASGTNNEDERLSADFVSQRVVPDWVWTRSS